MPTIIQPLPEMLGRDDVATLGEWDISTCSAVRGEPMTSIIDKQMVVPVEDTDKARVIRAHEMMHAKLSPAHDYAKWVERGVASDTAMKAVEEVRVNYLLSQAGFDVKELVDGSELSAGERIAELGDWAGAVYSAVGFTASGGVNQFITGVRRKNKEWAESLREISRRVEKEIAKAHKTGRLTSTDKCEVTGLSPVGFREVERIGQWVDLLAHPPSEDDDETESEDSTGEPKGKKPTPMKPDDIKKTRPAVPTGSGAEWANMKVETLPMPRRTRGGIGKKRKAMNMGTNPRRISRLLTDSERRVFDATKKGMGGVVLIDGSGSMQLSTADIMRITEASAGCTVAIYSTHSHRKDGGRLWVVAKNGRMVEQTPDDRGAGNGCDGHAIRWAIKNAHRGEPVVWVCDGIVTGWTDDVHEKLTMECAEIVRKHGVWMAPDVDYAVKVLGDLKRGTKPQRWIPRNFRITTRDILGALASR